MTFAAFCAQVPRALLGTVFAWAAAIDTGSERTLERGRKTHRGARGDVLTAPILNAHALAAIQRT